MSGIITELSVAARLGTRAAARRLRRELAPVPDSSAFADALHGLGIGATLLRKLIDVARTLGIQTLVGFVLSDNTQMLRLGRQTGFSQRTNREMGGLELTIDISSADLTEPEIDTGAVATVDASNHRRQALTI